MAGDFHEYDEQGGVGGGGEEEEAPSYYRRVQKVHYQFSIRGYENSIKSDGN